MPKKPRTISNQPKAVRELKERKRQIEFDKHRPNSHKRGYTSSRWRKLRTMVLNRDPICSMPSCDNPATDADHVVPRSLGGRDCLDNLQGLCHTCHSRKTAVEDSKFATGKPKEEPQAGPIPASGPPPNSRRSGVG